MQTKKYRPRMQLCNSAIAVDSACLEHIFASKTVKSVDVFSRVAALTVEGLQALGKHLDNFRTHKSGPVERVSGTRNDARSSLLAQNLQQEETNSTIAFSFQSGARALR